MRLHGVDLLLLVALVCSLLFLSVEGVGTVTWITSPESLPPNTTLEAVRAEWNIIIADRDSLVPDQRLFVPYHEGEPLQIEVQ